MHSTLLAALVLAGSAVAAPHRPTPRQANGAVQYAGTNIAGFEFGCAINGTCDTSKVSPPLLSLGGADGAGQMQHFVSADGFNVFRLPVGWQFLVNHNLGGTLDPGNLQKYDQLVQTCLSTGASCIIDIHNYARWNGAIIGQGGPTNGQFVSLWEQLATKYGNEPKIMFGIMNEPHEVPDINAWADTLQAVVDAIRPLAAENLILLPGNNWTSAKPFPTESGPALLQVKNPDGTTDGLVFEVHKYLDTDNSGTHTECVTDNVDGAFAPLATWLRQHGRQALDTETGGGNTESCERYMCRQIAYLNQNADVYLGYVGWSAGAFNAQTYELSEVPTQNGSTWTDSSLVQACLAR